MSAPLALPEPENARDLTIERLMVQRDMAIADAKAARDELHRTLCALRLEVMHLESVERGYAVVPALRVTA